MNKVKKKSGYKVKHIVICHRIIKWYSILGVSEYTFTGIQHFLAESRNVKKEYGFSFILHVLKFSRAY